MRGPNSKRNELFIIKEILSLERMGKSDMMYGANISYRQLKKYLPFLLEKGFLEAVNNKRNTSFRITEKGKRFLKLINNLEELLE